MDRTSKGLTAFFTVMCSIELLDQNSKFCVKLKTLFEKNSQIGLQNALQNTLQTQSFSWLNF
jgi:hypothetical protein